MGNRTLSFSVFLDKILKGHKLQTIRRIKKNPLETGREYATFWKQRSIYSEHCRTCGEGMGTYLRPNRDSYCDYCKKYTEKIEKRLGKIIVIDTLDIEMSYDLDKETIIIGYYGDKFSKNIKRVFWENDGFESEEDFDNFFLKHYFRKRKFMGEILNFQIVSFEWVEKLWK